jgi:hypothetical protein
MYAAIFRGWAWNAIVRMPCSVCADIGDRAGSFDSAAARYAHVSSAQDDKGGGDRVEMTTRRMILGSGSSGLS